MAASEQIVSYSADRSVECARDLPDFADAKRHPIYGSFGLAYYPHVFGSQAIEQSFAVRHGDRVRALVDCNVWERTLAYFGMPICPHFSSDLHHEQTEAICREVVEELLMRARSAGATKVVLRDSVVADALSPLGEACLARGGACRVEVRARSDLRHDAHASKRGLRKSFKSLINWGRRNLVTRYVNAVNPDRELFAQYQAFHREVSGRATRSQASWDVMYDWIVAGGGELVLGYLDQHKLVAGNLVIDGTDTCYYASAVNDRAEFDKPLGHWPMFHAIQRAPMRGMKWFDLGELPFAGTVTNKEYQIGYFKRGFASELQVGLVWTIPALGE